MTPFRPHDLLIAEEPAVDFPTAPLSSPIHPTSVYACQSTQQAEELLKGEAEGYVYQRDGHPNAAALADACRRWHGAEEAAVTASGMAALSLALLSQLQAGDRLLVGRRIYGRSLQLLEAEASRWGVQTEIVETSDLGEVETALRRPAKMVVTETLANPRLRVAHLERLAELSHDAGALLLIDNTFASPYLCRPLEWGADLVVESVTKMINGHSDVTLGWLCGRQEIWERVPATLSTWGLTSSPFDCWLALRGAASLALRMRQACGNALKAAGFLAERIGADRVDYPGLPNHPDHALAQRQFGGEFGSMITFHLENRAAADRLISRLVSRIPFCPSLGEIRTTLSHPQSTSHLALSEQERKALGVVGGTIRLSVGAESPEYVLESLEHGLGGASLE